jgi:hypothetical protein
MLALGKSLSAKQNVRAPAAARPGTVVRSHPLLFLLVGEGPKERLVEENPVEGFGGRRHAPHVIAKIRRGPGSLWDCVRVL